MEWRVTIEPKGADGATQTHEVARGGGIDFHSPLDPAGLTLDDGKTLLAGVPLVPHFWDGPDGSSPKSACSPPATPLPASGSQ